MAKAGEGAAEAASAEEKAPAEQLEDLQDLLPTLKLNAKDEALKKKLLEEGFGDWTRKDFRSFTLALEQFGRKDRDAVCRQVAHETGKGEGDVERYLDAFNRCAASQLAEYAKVMEKVERGEKKIARQTEIAEALSAKVSRAGADAFQTLTVNYTAGGGGGARGKIWTEDEDAFLVCMMHRHGYGAWERIRSEVRRAWQFKFDWFFKSRSSAELQRRGDVLLRCIEKENEDVAKKEKADKAKKAKKGGGNGGGDKAGKDKKRGSSPGPGGGGKKAKA